MKRYCLRPDIKKEIKELITILGTFYLIIAIVIAILQPIIGHDSLAEENNFIIALVVSGDIAIIIFLYIVIKYTMKNYKSWFVEC